MRLSIVSGGFDPLHVGHVKLLQEAERYGDALVVLVNTDEWLMRKKGYVSLGYEERARIVGAMEAAWYVRKADDEDGTVCNSLLALKDEFPDATFVFCNGGDRGRENTPEQSIIEQIGGQCVFGVGGVDKANSSSLIFPRHYVAKVDRAWGYYTDHMRTESCVFKTLHLLPNQGTSYQRHQNRTEVWYVEEGSVEIRIGANKFLAQTGANVRVEPNQWHSVRALTDGAVVREMQFGICAEDDIERAA